MAYKLQAFISSSCYELRDLRAAIRESLTSLGIEVMLSDERGFPHVPDMPPYASCLCVLEECPLFIGVVERYYGKPFDDWGPYSSYSGLSPIHAEFRHALECGKRCFFFVQAQTVAFYETWRKDPDAYKNDGPYGLNVKTLELYQEIKTHEPAPWIVQYNDSTDVIAALRANLVNEIYTALREREKRNSDLTKYLLDEILGAAPEIRTEIENELNPRLVERLSKAQEAASMLEEQLTAAVASSTEVQDQLQVDLDEARAELERVRAQWNAAMATLVRAALKDAQWLHRIRTTLMPKQPGRVPFHNGKEVGIRGFNVHRFGKPVLAEVTWSRLPYREGRLHRGYDAGLIFKGQDFAPGVTIAWRQIGDESSPPRWRSPNIYFDSYLELSTGKDELESPLGYRTTEFAVRNPDGDESEWLLFSFDFDDRRLHEELDRCEARGRELFESGQFDQAVEPLRRAMVFSRHLLDEDDERAAALHKLWNDSLDQRDLARMRFKKDDRVDIVGGDGAGASGVLIRAQTRHVYPYTVRTDCRAPRTYSPLNAGRATN